MPSASLVPSEGNLGLVVFLVVQMRGGWGPRCCQALRSPVVKKNKNKKTKTKTKKKQNGKSHKKVCIKTYFCTTWGLFLHVSNKTS